MKVVLGIAAALLLAHITRRAIPYVHIVRTLAPCYGLGPWLHPLRLQQETSLFSNFENLRKPN
jgi:hypothetical protein